MSAAKVRAALAALWIVSAGCANRDGCVELKVTTLASAQREYGAVALDATHVYWVDRGTPDVHYADGAIRRVPKLGGDAVTLAAVPERPQKIAVDASGVFFTADDGGVRRAPIEGGKPVIVIDKLRSPYGLAIDKDRLIISESIYNGDVIAVPKAGGAKVVLASGEPRATDLAIDGEYAYWTCSGGSVDDGLIRKVKLTGGEVTTLADKQRTPRAIAIDKDSVYWVSSVPLNEKETAQVILKVAKTGGPVTPVASGVRGLDSIAVDDKHVYYSAVLGGVVMRVPKKGGDPAKTATRQNGPTAIAIDQEAVYFTTDAWTTRGVAGQKHEGSVRRATK